MSWIATTWLGAGEHGRRGIRLAHFIWLMLGLLLACQITIWSKPAPPELAVLEHFAIQLSGLAVLSAVLSLLLRRWLRLALSLALAVSLAAPTVAESGLANSGQAPGLADPARLKLLTVNLWHDAPEHQATINALMGSGADVIGLVEVTPAWREVLQPVIAAYPYRVDCFASERDCQAMLLSKLPMEKTFAGRIWKSNPIIAGGEITWQGRTVAIVATHLTRPLVRKDDSQWYDAAAPDLADYLAESVPFNRQATQAGKLAKYLNSLPADLIVLGDFNAAPWSRVQRAFRARTGLENHAGWASSWPAWAPWPLRLPLDHVLSRGHLVVAGFTAGPEIDSDHLPLAAEIGWRDEPAAQTASPN